MTIYPYRVGGVWMFDDPRHNLVREPFVLGTGEILDAALKLHKVWPGAHQGFRLDFSSEPVEGWEQAVLDEPDNGGAWYAWNGLRGWLCPALLHYFPRPPESLWFRVSRKGAEAEAAYRRYCAGLRDAATDAEAAEATERYYAELRAAPG